METQNTKRSKKLNNKGFSLIELIIVMAIMAILVGVVGTQVIPYIEKSRESKDFQIVSSLSTAAATAFATNAEAVADNAITITSLTADSASTDVKETIKEDIRELLGLPSTASDAAFFGKMTSKKGKATTNKINITYDNNGKLTVEIKNSASKNIFDPIVTE